MKQVALLLFLYITITPTLEDGACNDSEIDLGLILDGSGSIGRRNWNKVKEFTIKLVEQFNVSPKKTHISVMVYSTTPNMEFKFGDSKMKNEVLRRLALLSLPRGSTFIDKALLLANEQMFSSASGMRPKAIKVAVVTTDGQQTIGSGPYTPLDIAASHIKKKGVIVFAIGIGSNVDLQELHKIASGDKRVILARTFDDLHILTSMFKTEDCILRQEIVNIDFKTRFPSLVFMTFKNTRLPLCADNWEETTAKVACKTKGFSDGERGRPTETTIYQSVYKQFWKVQINCTGREDFIEGCSLKAINISSKCKGDRLATVSCKVNLRTEGGTSGPSSGRVEVFFMGIWGTVCRDNWDFNVARVVCRQMNYEDAVAEFELISVQSMEEKPTLFGNIQCYGNETSVMECPFVTVPRLLCKSKIPASLVCRPKNIDKVDISSVNINSTELILSCDTSGAQSKGWYVGNSKINKTARIHISDKSLTIKNVQPSDGKVYICYGSRKNHLFRVYVLANVDRTKTKQILRANTNGQIVCKADGAPKPTFEWSYDEDKIPYLKHPFDEGNGVLRFHEVGPEHEGSYKCTVSQTIGSGGTKSSRTIQVVVYGPLNFTQTPPSLCKVPRGGNLIINCSASGIPTPRLIWKHNEQILNNSISAVQLKLYNIQKSGIYTCEANSGETTIRSSTTVEVLVQPSIISILDDASLEMGKQFKRTCGVTGNPLPSVVWTKDGSYHFPAGRLKDKNKTLIIERVQPEDSGVYNCTASNIVGSTWDSLQLTVLEQKVISANDDVKWYAIGGSVVLVVIIVLALVVLYFRNRAAQGDVTATEQIQSLKDEWEFPRSQLTLVETIGKGAFGEVWKAIAKGLLKENEETIVAVKQAKNFDFIGALEKEIKQGKALGTDRHPNVCNFLGCITVSEPVTVITEFAEYGDLLDFLSKCKGEHDEDWDEDVEPLKVLASYDLLLICLQIASGMDFLHSKGIIHRDLAARNVLVAEGHQCKITDFGLAIERGHYGYASEAKKGQLPIKWSAPELLFESEFRVTAKIDIWSYGILMYEIATIGGSPYPGWSTYQVLVELQHNNYRMEKPEHASDFMYNLMMLCWQNDPEKRPSFNQIQSMLVNSQKTEYLDIQNVDVEISEPHLYQNVNDECETTLLLGESTSENRETSKKPAQEKGSDNGGPSTKYTDGSTARSEFKSVVTRESDTEPFAGENSQEQVEMSTLFPFQAKGNVSANSNETCI